RDCANDSAGVGEDFRRGGMRGADRVAGRIEHRFASSTSSGMLRRRNGKISRYAAENGCGCTRVRQSAKQSGCPFSVANRGVVRARLVTGRVVLLSPKFSEIYGKNLRPLH